MPGYIAKALKVFQHKARTNQDQPIPSAPIQYGVKTQYAKERSTAPLLESKLVPGLWKHEWRPIQFTLVVDDFGVKYVGKEHALHLKSTLEDNYGVTTEWDGKRYIGITLYWDYERR